MLKRWLRRPEVQRALGIAAIVFAIAYSRWSFDSLTAPQQPAILPDSVVYLQTASQSPRVDHLFFPKPITVPAVYRLVDGKPARVVRLQRELAFWSWWSLGLTLVVALRRRRARALAVAATVGFLLAPARVGFTGTILSESINDSLMALVAAGAIALATVAERVAPGRRRTIACAVLAGLIGVWTAAWIGCRDTCAVAALAMVAAAAIAWRPWRAVGSRAWGVSLGAAVTVLALLSLWSAGVRPDAPTGLTVDQAFQHAGLARRMQPLVNNLFVRVLPHPSALAFFRSRGMPCEPALLADPDGWADAHRDHFMSDPEHRAMLAWLEDHGTTTWAMWLVRHPIDRADEVVEVQWPVLASQGLVGYMPPGWTETWRGHPLIDFLRHTTTYPLLLSILLLGAPMCVRGARRPLREIAFCAIAGAIASIPAAHFGDAIEIERHCFGGAQQLLLGLVILALARADAGSPAPGTGPARPASTPPTSASSDSPASAR